MGIKKKKRQNTIINNNIICKYLFNIYIGRINLCNDDVIIHVRIKLPALFSRMLLFPSVVTYKVTNTCNTKLL